MQARFDMNTLININAILTLPLTQFLFIFMSLSVNVLMLKGNTRFGSVSEGFPSYSWYLNMSKPIPYWNGNNE